MSAITVQEMPVRKGSPMAKMRIKRSDAPTVPIMPETQLAMAAPNTPPAEYEP